ncbi:MAG: SGNH/GDSL hydrolase family protein [Lentimonas sp.]
MNIKTFLSLGLILTGLSSLTLSAAPEAGSLAEIDKHSDWTFTPDPNLPNVLILGDSISIGYTLQVRHLSKGKANVFRPMSSNGKRRVNCGGTIAGVKNIDNWLAVVPRWDVIHFNWGLHDLKHVKKPGTSEKSNDPKDPTQATLEEYAANLQVIVDKLKATDAQLIFATTTPVVSGTLNPLRIPKTVVRYNEAAVKIMDANEIPVNDLYGCMLPNLEKWQLPRNCHFKPQGSDELAKQVAKNIQAALGD